MKQVWPILQQLVAWGMVYLISLKLNSKFEVFVMGTLGIIYAIVQVIPFTIHAQLYGYRRMASDDLQRVRRLLNDPELEPLNRPTDAELTSNQITMVIVWTGSAVIWFYCLFGIFFAL